MWRKGYLRHGLPAVLAALGAVALAACGGGGREFPVTDVVRTTVVPHLDGTAALVVSGVEVPLELTDIEELDVLAGTFELVWNTTEGEMVPVQVVTAGDVSAEGEPVEELEVTVTLGGRTYISAGADCRVVVDSFSRSRVEGSFDCQDMPNTHGKRTLDVEGTFEAAA